MDEPRKPKFTSHMAPVGANHEWILDVVEDLQAYAEQNNLAQVKASATEMLAVARSAILGEGEAKGALIMTIDNAPRSLN